MSAVFDRATRPPRFHGRRDQVKRKAGSKILLWEVYNLPGSTDNRSPKIADFVPLAKLEDLVFGGWDIFDDNAYEAAMNAGVLEQRHLEPLREALERMLRGAHIKKGSNKMDLARLVMVWCGSTETFQKPSPVHSSLREFECGLEKSDPEIAPSQIYAYAALKSGVPFANGAPNLTVDTPALQESGRACTASRNGCRSTSSHR